MLLEARDLHLFFRLHRTLMLFVNQRLKVIPDDPATPEDFGDLAPEVRIKVRDVLLANIELIESFVTENPARLPEKELDIVRSWRHLVTGRFLVFQELKKFTVFLSASSPAVAYGVLALSQPFEELIGPRLPVMIQAVLLPFQDKIVYDGLLTRFPITFGPGFRRIQGQELKDAKARHGIVTSLPVSQEARPPKPRKTKKASPPKSPEPEEAAKPLSLKEITDQFVQIVVRLIDEFCKEHLNEEYAVLCRKLAEKLGRKRPSPLLQGNLNAWASGIVRAVGGVNFLHDKTQTPYMRSTDIDYYLGTSPSSGAAKLAAIRKMFKVYQGAPEWSLPSRLKDNPMVWMLQVDGLVMDIRKAPRDLQELAFRKGLIPYIPADRGEGG